MALAPKFFNTSQGIRYRHVDLEMWIGERVIETRRTVAAANKPASRAKLSPPRPRIRKSAMNDSTRNSRERTAAPNRTLTQRQRDNTAYRESQLLGMLLKAPQQLDAAA